MSASSFTCKMFSNLPAVQVSIGGPVQPVLHRNFQPGVDVIKLSYFVIYKDPVMISGCLTTDQDSLSAQAFISQSARVLAKSLENFFRLVKYVRVGQAHIVRAGLVLKS